MYEPIVFEEREHRGYTCRVVYDQYPMSPNDWDTLGQIYSNHRDYNPCNHKIDEVLIEDEDGNTVVDPDYIYVNVWCYEHGGIALSCSRTGQFSDPWDSGLFGIMAVHKDKAEEEFGDLSVPENLERVLKRLEGEVKDWDTYCHGEVFGFEVLDENDCIVDSCWGFYGYDGAEEAMKEGIGIIDYEVDKQEREEAEHQARVERYEMIAEPFWID